MITKYHPIRFVVFLLAILTLSACAPQANAQTAGPVKLRLAISDSKKDAHDEAYLLEFIDQANKLSNGEITIQPVWDAGKNSGSDYEAGTIQLVRIGRAELGVAPARAWDKAGIQSFEALQAPFLIDNDALAVAVATSDIATKMLDSLSQYGVTGLTIWPEDLRHPFSTIPDKPILSPADFTGRKIRVPRSVASEKLIEALGGTPMYGEGGYDGAESGLRQASSLTGTPTATANVTFYSKYQVLFANKTSFEKLSEAQQAILRQAAAAAQKKAIAEHPSDLEAAKTWCSEVGAVVLASDEQIAAFEKAAQPVFDWIEQDPLNAEMVAAIRDLKAKTPPSPAVQACAPEVAQQNPSPAPHTQNWSTGLPPNGTWQVTLTNEDFIKMGVSKAKAPEWSGIYTLTIQDGDYKFFWQGTPGQEVGNSTECMGTYEVVEDFVRITYTYGNDCKGEFDDIQWQLDDQGQLYFHVVAIHNAPFIENKAYLEAKPYQKVENWSKGLPPIGSWQVTLTSEDVMKLGVSKVNAAEWSGIFTNTFKENGEFHTTWQGTEGSWKGQTNSCDGTYKLVEDYVRIMLSSDCGNEVDNIRWRIDADGLHVHVLSIQNGKTVEITAILEAKPYQKVAGK